MFSATASEGRDCCSGQPLAAQWAESESENHLSYSRPAWGSSYRGHWYARRKMSSGSAAEVSTTQVSSDKAPSDSTSTRDDGRETVEKNTPRSGDSIIWERCITSPGERVGTGVTGGPGATGSGLHAARLKPERSRDSFQNHEEGKLNYTRSWVVILHGNRRICLLLGCGRRTKGAEQARAPHIAKIGLMHCY
ncbi:hypothetical protein BJV78DRAFT_1151488 [Lactifluus subvellereus]|nr:hypothetical protein BJV78DRAFT_1151488 [Lactifluus subvellereus]